MTNDDKQLIKDIAVICGLVVYWQFDEWRVCVTEGDDYYFNPLADTIEAEAFCWRLMIKNKLDWLSRSQLKVGAVKKGDMLIIDESPQRAILLAVRELNKDKLNP